MTYPLELQRFIVDHPVTWETLLSKEPYYLTIKRSDDRRVLFKYNQIMSDFSLQICREARGVILEEGTWNIVAIAFNKFFNLGEEYAADIDWDSAQIQEKLDGSLIKLYFWNGRWRFSTNGSIDPTTASVEFPGDGIHSFQDLIEHAFEKYTITKELNLEETYIFEICGPYTRIVVPYEDVQLFHIGTRSNITGEEFDVDIGIPKPKRFHFNSLEEVIEFSETLDYTKEGFVVVDKNYNRVKIKGSSYVRMHYLLSGGSVNKKLWDIYEMGERGEVVSYLPHLEEKFKEIEDIVTYLTDCYHEIRSFIHTNIAECVERKELALNIKDFKPLFNSFGFDVYGEKDKDIGYYVNKFGKELWENNSTPKKSIKEEYIKFMGALFKLKREHF